jgi:hypothetical protein
VTVTGGPATGPAAPARPGGALLVLGLLGGAALLAVLVRAPPPDPPPPVDASVRLVTERIASSFGGDIVLPLELDNPGPAVVLDVATVRGEPVRRPSTAGGATRVGSGERVGLVAIVQPDCAALQSGAAFRATARFVLQAETGQAAELALDLGADPAVAARVAAVCRR